MQENLEKAKLLARDLLGTARNTRGVRVKRWQIMYWHPRGGQVPRRPRRLARRIPLQLSPRSTVAEDLRDRQPRI